MRNPTPRELEVLAAWAEVGSVVGAARFLGISEQRAKSLLYMLRIRSHASSNVELFRQHYRDLPSIERGRSQHNVLRA